MPRQLLDHAEKARRQAARVKAYADSNKDAIRAYQAAYRAANRETAALYAKEYAARNADALRDHKAAYRVENKEVIAAKDRAYYKKNPEKFSRLRHARRARVRAVGGSLSLDIVSRLMSLQQGKCINCRGSLQALGHHLDHIKPISRGGPNTDENVQLLCPSCNFKKHAKDPVRWAQENGRLL